MLNEKLYSDVENSKRLVKFLLGCIGILLVCHLTNLILGKPSYNIDRLFHMGHEGNLPTWFSSILWAIAAILAYQCRCFTRIAYERKVWLFVAIILMLLSVDEVAMIHEHLFGNFLGNRLKTIVSRKWIRSWVVVAMPFLVIGTIWIGILLKKCLRGSHKAARLFMLGVGTLFISVVFLEFLQPQHFDASVITSPLFELEMLMEETGEMIGVLFFIAGLLLHGRILYERNVDT